MGLSGSTRQVRLFTASAAMAAVLYAAMAGVGLVAGHPSWGDRSPVGVGLFTVIWLALAAAAAFSVAGVWRARDRTGKAPSSASLTAGSLDPCTGSKPWRQGTALLVGLVTLATLYEGAYQTGLIVGGDWGTWAYQPQANRLFPFPSLWNFRNLGSSNLAGTSSYMLESVGGFLGHLGVGYGTAERALFYLPVVLFGYFGVYFLVRRVVGGDILPVASAVFFMASVPVIAFFVGGWFTLLAGAVALPWLVLASERYLEQPTASRAVAVGGVLGLAGWYDPRNIYLDGIGGVVYLAILLLSNPRQTVQRLLRPVAVLAPLVLVAFQIQWLVPYLFGFHTAIPGSYFTAASAKTFSFNSLGDGLSAFNYAWPVMKTGVAQIVPALWAVVPFAVAVALWTSPRSRYVLFAVASYLTYALLAAGAQPPFGPLYIQMFLSVPGANLYRDTSPYLLPTTFMATVLIAVAVRATGNPLSPRWHERNSGGLRSHRVRFVLGSLLVLGCTAVLGTIFVTIRLNPRRLTGELASVQLPERYKQVNSYLVDHPSGATLWVPSTPGFALRGVSTHPNISAGVIGAQWNTPDRVGSSPVSWIESRSLLELSLRLYHVRYLVARTDPSAYGSNSRRSSETLRSTLVDPLIRYLCTLGCRRFGSLVVADVNPHAGGPLTLVSSESIPRSVITATTNSPSVGKRTNELSSQSALGNECLGSTTFGGADLHNWQPVINGDNFAKLSLRSSGVTEQIKYGGVARLTVGSGAATIMQRLSGCPVGGGISVWNIRVHYRTYSSDYLQAEIYRNAAVSGYCVLPSSGKWVTGTCTVTLPSGMSSISRHAFTPSLILSLFPASNTVQSFAHESKALIGSVSVQRFDTSAAAQLLAQHGVIVTRKVVGGVVAVSSSVAPASPAVSAPRATGESTSLVKPTYETTDMWRVRIQGSSRARETLVLWESYDMHWVMTDLATGRPLRHVVINGWANGYVLPRSGTRGTTFTIAYTGQEILDSAMLAEWCVVGLVALISVITVVFGIRKKMAYVK